jgi:transposase
LVMQPYFRPYEPEQQLLLPPSLQDWLPAGHLAYFISDTVDQLDLSEILSAYRASGQGNVAYHPAMMLKLLIYGYATGLFSSRRIARACDTDIAFRILAAGDPPSHRTLARFRMAHLDVFQLLFVQVVQIAQASGLVKLGTLAIDGSKVRANASKHKAMSYERMQKEEEKLRREIAALTARAQGQDESEDVEFGPDFRGDELPAELARRQNRLATIQAAKKRLEERKQAAEAEKIEAERLAEAKRKREGRAKRGRERTRPLGKPEPKDQESFTDPDSRIMKTKEGFQQCYNAQIAVDGEGRIIVATEVTQCSADTGALLPVLDAARENTQEDPGTVLADCGYKSEANFLGIEERGLTACVPLGREGKAGLKSIDKALVATRRMHRRMKGERGRKKYKARKHIAEPPFGWVKNVLGFRQFSLRGHRKVSGEWNLVCLAMNLRRMGRTLAWR